MNDQYEPDDDAEAVLAVFKAEDARLTPRRIRSMTDLRRQYVHNALKSLTDAGWIERVDRGLYEFVADPRDLDDSETTDPADAATDDRDR